MHKKVLVIFVWDLVMLIIVSNAHFGCILDTSQLVKHGLKDAVNVSTHRQKYIHTFLVHLCLKHKI